MDWGLSGSSDHGILQERMMDWVAIYFSRGFSLTQGSNLCLLHWQVDYLLLAATREAPIWLHIVHTLF